MVEEKLINWKPLVQAFESLDRRWQLYAAVSILAIIIELGYFALYAIPWSKFGVAEWAYWVAAIGTTGTLIGTIWLASAEARIRHARERARSYIVAAALAPRLELLASDVGLFNTALIFGRPEERGATVKELADNFLSIVYERATTEDLMALEAMPNNCATKLAFAQAQFFTIRAQIQRLAELLPFSERPITLLVADRWRNWTTDLSQRLEVLARQCREAADTHAASPTSYELFGEPSDDEDH